MRYVVAVICTAVLMGVFSGCTEDVSGASGLSCPGPGAAPKGFVKTLDDCAAPAGPGNPPGSQCRLVPTALELTIDGGEGSTFCTTPGTPATFQIGTPPGYSARAATLTSEAPCNKTSDYQIAYTYQYQGGQTLGFPAYPAGSKGTFTMYVRGDTSQRLATAQFCFDTDYSGFYEIYGTDGSTQTGTWSSLASSTCNYVEGIGGPECKEYAGVGWTNTTATEDCEGGQGTWSATPRCPTDYSPDKYLGWCAVTDDLRPEEERLDYLLQYRSSDPADCASASGDCTARGGTWTWMDICRPPPV
jgi:hypothetical protein